MRNFSEYEKELIEKIVKTDLRKSNVLDVISEISFNDRGVKIEKNKILFFYFKTDKNATYEFFETLFLIKYLELNYLIFIHKNYDNPNNGDYISRNLTPDIITQNQSELIFEPIPTNVCEFIKNYRKSYLFVGTELKKLVENKFKTNEQIHHETEIAESRKQTKISKYSFFISLAALLFSLLAPFIFVTNLDQNQIDSIKQELKNNSTTEVQELEKIRNELKLLSDSVKIKAQTLNNVYKK